MSIEMQSTLLRKDMKSRKANTIMRKLSFKMRSMRLWSKRKTNSISLTSSTCSIEKCNISRISMISVLSSWINSKVSENNSKNERRSANWQKRFEPQTGG